MQPRIEQGEVSVSPLDVGLVGLGPFKLERYERRSVIRVRRFDQYWGKAVDGDFPYLGGIELIRRLKREYPQCQVVALTFYDQFFNETLAACAVGYLEKDLRREELVQAIRTVLDGRSPLHLTIDRSRLSEMAAGGGVQLLSEREQAILRLVAAGGGIQEIAYQLAFSESTVKRSLRLVMEKIGARNRSESVAEAIRRNLI